MDSPLAIDATTVFEMHPKSFDRSEEMVLKAKELFSSSFFTTRAM
jgi:hypothetical protein